MQDLICKAMTEFEADPEVGAIVLTGSGRAFCAGADLTMLAGGASRRKSSSANGQVGR